ncbi:MAG: hypothetical protein M0R74_00710 [Dehalococcoidia bacterium]|nr:hypothetical protein [Dehalococcoidia bacterium]
MTLKRLLLQFGAGVFIAVIAIGLVSGREENTAQACGPAGPYDFDTYEAQDFRNVYARAMELATAGNAITFNYTLASGEDIDVRYQGLQRGPRNARVTGLDTSLAIPPTIYKSIAWIEANWMNGNGDLVPWGGVGPVLRSFDCGYGIGQITSGMENADGTPTGPQAVIGTHFLFNIAEGVRILAYKWNSAPTYRPIAGNGDPAMLEDWYYAIWSYNGFANTNHPLYDVNHVDWWDNHPNNPWRHPLRPDAYHCGEKSAPGFNNFNYGDFTYPERVYGCVRYPARDKHGVRLWEPQTFNMPDFNLPEIASAFSLASWRACAGELQCAGMDFPTTIQREGVDITPHRDTTPPRSPSEAYSLLGDPHFSFSGPSSMSLTGYSDGTSTKGTVTVHNDGTFVGPYRIRTSHPWIIVRHPGDPPSRSLDAGVVVGRETEVVITSDPRRTQQGYSSVLEISLAPRQMPPGVSTGTVWIEPLLGSGSTFRIDIVGANGASNFRYQRVVPNVAIDGS